MKHPAGYRYFHIVCLLYTACLLISNTIASKLITIWGFTVPAGIIVFSVTYILNDIIAEVYGFKRSMSAIWWSFFALGLMTLCYYVTIILPIHPQFNNQLAIETVFSRTPQIAVASLVAFLFGSYMNAFVMSKMKVAAKGKSDFKRFGARAVLSTLVGETVDSIIFNGIAWIGFMQIPQILQIGLISGLLKSLYEFIALPLTTYVVRRIKAAEEIDTVDYGIDYNFLPLNYIVNVFRKKK